MSATPSPTVRRRRLAAELRKLREVSEMTCEEVAERLECSSSKISRMETGRVGIHPRDVRDLLDLYEAVHSLPVADRAVRSGDPRARKLVTARMARRQLLTKSNPKKIWAILEEAVLRRTVGGPIVLRDRPRTGPGGPLCPDPGYLAA